MGWNKGYTNQAYLDGPLWETAIERRTVSPEQQIANVAKSLDELLTMPRHRWQTEAIRQTVQQLRDMTERHVRGELRVIEQSDIPF